MTRDSGRTVGVSGGTLLEAARHARAAQRVQETITAQARLMHLLEVTLGAEWAQKAVFYSAEQSMASLGVGGVPPLMMVVACIDGFWFSVSEASWPVVWVGSTEFRSVDTLAALADVAIPALVDQSAFEQKTGLTLLRLASPADVHR